MPYNPSFPDVPNVPGVPTVQRIVQAAVGSVANSAANVVLGAAQQLASGLISNVQSVVSNGVSSLVNGAFGAPPSLMTGDSADATQAAVNSSSGWGIYDSTGTDVVLQPDSFVALGYKQSYSVSNFPMEQGAFQSYNKVNTPFDVKVTMTKGGSDADRQSFLSAAETLVSSFDLYQIVTPDETYSNVSASDWSYQRTSVKGVKMLTVEIAFVEIRLPPSSSAGNAATDAGQAQVNTGIVQSVALTTGNTDTASSISAAVTGGASVATAVSAGIAVAPNVSSLAANGVASVLSTVTPAVSAELLSIATSVTPIAATVASQASVLSRFM